MTLKSRKTDRKGDNRTHVGDIRPSQLMYTYGVGSIVDLPRMSVIVKGLDDWSLNPNVTQAIIENRLLEAVRSRLHSVRTLQSPPYPPTNTADPFAPAARIGVPVATFPRWLVCPACHLLAPLNSGQFVLDEDPYRPEYTVYRHDSCPKVTKGKKPEAIPARFLVACEAGHLDDFPWIEFVHQGEACTDVKSVLRLIEYGASGEARDLEVNCKCGKRRRLSEAFGRENREKMPLCTARRPHLGDYDPDGCKNRARAILLGASNLWFPIVLNVISLPTKGSQLAKLVDADWTRLSAVTMPDFLPMLRQIAQLNVELSEFTDEQIWEAIQERHRQDAGNRAPSDDAPDLKAPEWEIFTSDDDHQDSEDDEFRTQRVDLSPEWPFPAISRVLLVERLREVQAMIGFARLDAVGELTDPNAKIEVTCAPLSKNDPTWVPASDMRGEGIFIQFDENAIRHWETRKEVQGRAAKFLDAHTKWRRLRKIKEPERDFPGMRYVLLHSFSHALMRQFALECGYGAASLKERIYARGPMQPGGPMAGILIYTSAADSEGTLGGLVALGEEATLSYHASRALESAGLCASDPLCAEREPDRLGRTVHAAACHTCLFAPETSCERGNRYLDRTTLVNTLASLEVGFFMPWAGK